MTLKKLTFVVGLLAIIFVLPACSGAQSEAEALPVAPVENALAPDFELTDMQGNAVRLNDYRGKVVLVNFWATWCPPCVEEIPSLGRLQQKFSTEELVVVSVDVGEEKASVQEFLKKVPARYPVMLDPDGRTVADWNLRAFPTTFVVDREGRISLAYFGGLQWDSSEIVDQLRGLLAQEK
jgi:thiol-disulfide isomerase/thioredoxin